MAKTKFRPLHDRVVVRRIEADEKTKGGIIIPDTVKEKPSEGEIIAVGPGGRDENGKLTPMGVKAGDRVLFGKWSRHRGQARRRGPPDHEGVRHHGRDRLSHCSSSVMAARLRRPSKDGPQNHQPRCAGLQAPHLTRMTSIPNSWSKSQWLPRKSNSPPTRATACCAASTFSPMP